MNNIFNYTIGFFGSISTGKSTLINSIFAKLYSEMKIDRNTSIPHAYHFTNLDYIDVDIDENIRSHTELFDNKFLNEKWDGKYIEHINVSFPPGIFTENSNMSFTIYDLPGLNDYETDAYIKWAETNFNLFDCVILLVDITHGISSREDNNIFEMVFKRMASTSHTNLIVLVNKCDDMKDDGETIQNEELNGIYTKITDKFEKLRDQNLIDPLRIRYVKYSAKNSFIMRTIQHNDIGYIKSSINQDLINSRMKVEFGDSVWSGLNAMQQENNILKLKNNQLRNNGKTFEENYVNKTGFDHLREIFHEFTTNPEHIEKFYSRMIGKALSLIEVNSFSKLKIEEKQLFLNLAKKIEDCSLRSGFKIQMINIIYEKLINLFSHYIFSNDFLYMFNDLEKLQEFEDFIKNMSYIEITNYSKNFYMTLYQVFIKNLKQQIENFKQNVVITCDIQEQNVIFRKIMMNYIIPCIDRYSLTIFEKEKSLDELFDVFIRPSLWNDRKMMEWLFDLKFKKIELLITKYVNHEFSVSVTCTKQFNYLSRMINQLRTFGDNEVISNLIIFCDMKRIGIQHKLGFFEYEYEEIEYFSKSYKQEIGDFLDFIIRKAI